jgi:hypothetical protein
MPIPDRDIATLLDDALVERDSDMDEAWRTVESRAARSRNRRRVVAAVAGVLTVIGIAGIVEWRHTDRTTVTVAPTPTTDLAALPGTLGQLISDRIVSPSSGDPVTLPLQLLDGTSATFTVPSDVYAELKGYRVVARAALICTPGCGFTELAAEPGAGTLVGTEIGQLPGAEGTSVAVVDRGWTKALVFRTTHWTIQANTFNMPETNFGQWAEALRFNEGPDGWPVLSAPPGVLRVPKSRLFPGDRTVRRRQPSDGQDKRVRQFEATRESSLQRQNTAAFGTLFASPGSELSPLMANPIDSGTGTTPVP